MRFRINKLIKAIERVNRAVLIMATVVIGVAIYIGVNRVNAYLDTTTLHKSATIKSQPTVRVASPNLNPNTESNSSSSSSNTTSTKTTPSAPVASPAPTNTSTASCDSFNNQMTSDLASYNAYTGNEATNLLNQYEAIDEQGNTKLYGSPTLTTAQINNDIQEVNQYIQNENQQELTGIYDPYQGTQADRGCSGIVPWQPYPLMSEQQ